MKLKHMLRGELKIFNHQTGWLKIFGHRLCGSIGEGKHFWEISQMTQLQQQQQTPQNKYCIPMCQRLCGETEFNMTPCDESSHVVHLQTPPPVLSQVSSSPTIDCHVAQLVSSHSTLFQVPLLFILPIYQ